IPLELNISSNQAHSELPLELNISSNEPPLEFNISSNQTNTAPFEDDLFFMECLAIGSDKEQSTGFVSFLNSVQQYHPN
ncbi:hypothetical protein PIB30_107044, partial [Stylosanthes scabra]|nr:hypothetical protein [Stylosanthes scabra]